MGTYLSSTEDSVNIVSVILGSAACTEASPFF